MRSCLNLYKIEMNFDFLHNLPWFRADSSNTPVSNFGSTTILVEQPQQKPNFDLKLWGWSLSFLPIAPWTTRKDQVQRRPSGINRKLKRRVDSREVVVHSGSNSSGLRFRPYVSKVPWHTGPRALLSDLFPRYGHYCGPNWSSGKNGGSPIWDQRPIDWLDYCCYCHDIGYDTHDQGKLLEADLAFLDCLERPHVSSMKGDLRVARIYKTMCVAGLKNILIPYRMQLLKMMSKQPLVDFGWLGNVRWKSWNSSPKA